MKFHDDTIQGFVPLDHHLSSSLDLEIEIEQCECCIRQALKHNAAALDAVGLQNPATRRQLQGARDALATAARLVRG